jgi:hypothetical protein
MERLSIAQPESEGTNVRRFLAYRGAIVVKETRDIGQCKGNYGDSISIATMVLTVVKGTIRDTSYGVRLEHLDRDSNTDSSVFLDFDELDELMDAFDFVKSLAGELRSHQRDYTEVTYSTKDNARFGFYQNEQQQQQAFIALSPHGGMTFLLVEHLPKLKELLLAAKNHLVSRGATNV